MENKSIGHSCIVPKHENLIRGRRKTENLKQGIPESKDSLQRHSVGSTTRLSEAATSECSNDSYESAASVRLEKEVTQLHYFYNETALVIEQKLKNQFHDIYSCMSEDQQKILQEKEQLTHRVHEMENEYAFHLEEIKNKTKEMEKDRDILQNKIKQMADANDKLKCDYEEQINMLKKTDKSKKDAMAKMNVDLQKLNKELNEKSEKLKKMEEKLLNLSNQQAVKLAMLSKTKTALRSRSVERDKYELENATLKGQLAEANKKIIKLTTDLDKKNKMKLDLELKMSSKLKNGERNFIMHRGTEKSPAQTKTTTEELVKQFENTVRDVLKENLSNKGQDKTPDIENMIDAIQRKISILNEHCKPINNAGDKASTALEPAILTVLHSQIEHLQSQVKKAEETCSFHRDEAVQFKKELMMAEKQLADTIIELRVAQCEAKTFEKQLKVLQANKVDPEQLMKNFESTVKEVIKENLSNKESAKNPDFEGMFNKVHRKLSILSERQVTTTQPEKKEESSELTNAQILQAQIERLEVQMEKARERSVLSREEATQAKSKLAIAEKQLSDLKIDLRIAQRETRDAEEKIKELDSKLKGDTQQLATQLEEHQTKLRERELELATLKQTLDTKSNEVKLYECNLEDKTTVIHTLSKELQTMKTKIDVLGQEKMKIEMENKKRNQEVKELKIKIEQLKGEMKKKENNVSEVKQKEDEWKSKYQKLSAEAESLRETCEIQDRINVGFETTQQKLEEVLKQYEDEKIKLEEQMESVSDELKNARKLMNEEKSLKAATEDKLRRLEDTLRLQEEEMRALVEDKNEKLHQIATLEDKLKQFEECIFETNDSIEKSSQYIDLMKREIYSLKEERTELLTRLHRLKEENISLQNEMKEAIDEINSLQQINGESQQVLDQIKAYYEDRHIKDTETLHQYSKLNEFLLKKKVQDGSKKRTFADKLFRSKGKENLNPKEIENLLYVERKKNKELAEQLYQTKTEMMMQRSECSSPKQNTEFSSYVSAAVITSSSKNESANNTTAETPLRARMTHNIPHKFETKLCKKLGIKCAICSQVITFGHMSQCRECHVRCHVSCSVKIGPTCGLSKLLMNQLPMVVSSQAQSTSLGSSVKSETEAHVKVLRDKTWEKMNLVVDEKKLCLYEKSFRQPKEAKQQIHFSSIAVVDDNADKTLENISDADKRCTFNITYRNANKQEKVLHVLASSEGDKTNWMNLIRRNLPSAPKQISFQLDAKDRSRGVVLCEFTEPNVPVINHMISLSPELALMATDEGLYSLRINVRGDAPNRPVRIDGIGKVSRIKVLTKSRVALFICEKEDMVKKCDLRMLVSNAEMAACSMPSIVTEDVSSLTPIDSCKLLEASSCNSLLAIATENGLVILKASEEGFDEVIFDRKVNDVKCMLFTSQCLLFCTTNSEVFSVDLETCHEYRLNVFRRSLNTDIRRQNLQTIVKITSELYLICDQLFGVFVNAEGKRLKNSEMLKWPLPPNRIVYNKPFLCLGHDDNISLVYLPSSGDEESDKKYKFSIISYRKPTILGVIKEPLNGEYLKEPMRGVFIEDESDTGSRLYFLNPITFTRLNPRDSWSSIDTQLTGGTTDEECVRKSLNISDGTDISLNSLILEESGGEQSS